LPGAVFDRKQPQQVISVFPVTLSDEGIRQIGGQRVYSRCKGLFLTENSPPSVVTRPSGGAHPPPNIPGELSPPRDPFPSACEGGVHCYHAPRKASISAPAGLFHDARPFFARFPVFRCSGLCFHAFPRFTTCPGQVKRRLPVFARRLAVSMFLPVA
jgi:hypothetical protein